MGYFAQNINENLIYEKKTNEKKTAMFLYSDELLLFISELNFNEFGLFLIYFLISRLRLSSNFEHEKM